MSCTWDTVGYYPTNCSLSYWGFRDDHYDSTMGFWPIPIYPICCGKKGKSLLIPSLTFPILRTITVIGGSPQFQTCQDHISCWLYPIWSPMINLFLTYRHLNLLFLTKSHQPRSFPIMEIPLDPHKFPFDLFWVLDPPGPVCQGAVCPTRSPKHSGGPHRGRMKLLDAAASQTLISWGKESICYTLTWIIDMIAIKFMQY